MNEFTEMLREAFHADEPFDPDPGREAILDAITGFERRMRLVRRMTWLAVTFFTALAVWMLVLLLGADEETATKWLVTYAVVLVYALVGVGFVKGWLQLMLIHTRTMRELKRTQLMVLEGPRRG